MAFYDNKPSKLEAVGNGSYLYRWNINEVTTVSVEKTSEEIAKTTQYFCEEVTVWPPLTSNKITKAVITFKWDANYEQKLINEFNAAQLGLFGDLDSSEAKVRIAAYTDYLKERAALKKQVDDDCTELGIC